MLARFRGLVIQPRMPVAPTHPSSRQQFGSRLQTARKAAGLTQQQLGMEIGLEIDVAATRVNRYERGVHDPDSDTAAKLAARLGLPLAYFYSDNEALAEVVLTFAQLPPKKQQDALAALRTLASQTVDSD